MEYKGADPSPLPGVKPRVIIHGGSGNITRENLPPALWHAHRNSLIHILRSTHHFLESKSSKALPSALDAAVHAVSLLESDPLFNAGIGAVFTRAGTIELEASVMVSRGYRKRGTGVSLIKHVRSPIKLAAEMLKRGEEENGGGAQGHCQMSGPEIERLAKSWGLEMCEERTFWTKKRWDEHKRGLDKEDRHNEKTTSPQDNYEDDVVWPDNEPSWNGKDYLPQGTVGAVVLDAYGHLAVATSTGGLTNKLPGRLGDTPTLGAGFWAEEWIERFQYSLLDETISLGKQVSSNIMNLIPLDTIKDCILWSHTQDHEESSTRPPLNPPRYRRRAVAMSGTGNGDSFLRLCAVRTAAAIARFSQDRPITLQRAASLMAGPGGELQRSAGVNWGKTGEGLGGIIGIELVGSTGYIVDDFNVAMFRTFIDDHGKEQCKVFREEY